MSGFIQTYQNHFKETVKLAYPVSIAHLGHVMLGVVDSMMVGHVGADSLAAAALVNGVAFLFLVFGLGLSLIITPLVAIARGKRIFPPAGRYFRMVCGLTSFYQRSGYYCFFYGSIFTPFESTADRC